MLIKGDCKMRVNAPKQRNGNWAAQALLILPTLRSYAYTRILPKLRHKIKPETRVENVNASVAAVCDCMTWANLSHCHDATALTPAAWPHEIGKNPKFFFCEAAWSGAAGSCWRGQIYRDRRVFYENRKYLLEILKHCNARGIPSVFWAKEDPTYFMHGVYDFTDTALKFDHVLTTARECIHKYKSMGHKSVHLWPFGFSPHIYHPPAEAEATRESAAVFAGSWYREHKNRCRELEGIFEMILNAGIPLRIYDRNKKNGYSPKPFPAKYQKYVYDGTKYEELGEIYRNTTYAINVNTVNDSSTMFSRRVYEAAACGSIIVSNESKGLRDQFGKNIWYLGESFDLSQISEMRERNIKMVFENHTWQKRFEKLLEILSIEEVRN